MQCLRVGNIVLERENQLENVFDEIRVDFRDTGLDAPKQTLSRNNMADLHCPFGENNCERDDHESSIFSFRVGEPRLPIMGEKESY